MLHEAMKQSLQNDESAAGTSTSGKCHIKDDQNSQSSSNTLKE